MNSLLLIIRLILAGVFGAAGVAKLKDLRGSRKALTDFGLPGWLSQPFGIVVPLIEVATAVLLLPLRTAWLGGVVALVLLMAFVVAIVVNIAQGRHPDCHCFGQLHSKPIGFPTLARNGALAVCAGVVVWAGAGTLGPVAWISWMSHAPAITLFVSAVLIALTFETWLVFHVLQQNGRLLLRMDELEKRVSVGAAPVAQGQSVGQGLPVGAHAPGFALPTISGKTLTLDALRQENKPVVLIFSDPSCGPCTALMPEIGRWQREYAETVKIAIVSQGAAKTHRVNVERYSLKDVLLQTDREVSNAYQAHGTPAAILIHTDGTIGSRVFMGSDAIAGLIADTTRSLPSLPLPKPINNNGKGAQVQSPRMLLTGESAPSFTLPDLHGKKVALEDFKGKATLVAFWNPACGFCDRLLPDLKAWEGRQPKGAPQLLLVSTGTPETNLAMGLDAPVLLDANFSVGRQFGASGTPSAVLVDAEGRIASELKVGGPGLLALAGASPSNTKADTSLRTALAN